MPGHLPAVHRRHTIHRVDQDSNPTRRGGSVCSWERDRDRRLHPESRPNRPERPVWASLAPQPSRRRPVAVHERA